MAEELAYEVHIPPQKCCGELLAYFALYLQIASGYIPITWQP